MGLNFPHGAVPKGHQKFSQAYKRAFNLHFLDVKLQFLVISCSQLYPEETAGFFGSLPYLDHFGGFAAITPLNNIRLS